MNAVAAPRGLFGLEQTLNYYQQLQAGNAGDLQFAPSTDNYLHNAAGAGIADVLANDSNFNNAIDHFEVAQYLTPEQFQVIAGIDTSEADGNAQQINFSENTAFTMFSDDPLHGFAQGYAANVEVGGGDQQDAERELEAVFTNLIQPDNPDLTLDEFRQQIVDLAAGEPPQDGTITGDEAELAAGLLEHAPIMSGTTMESLRSDTGLNLKQYSEEAQADLLEEDPALPGKFIPIDQNADTPDVNELVDQLRSLQEGTLADSNDAFEGTPLFDALTPLVDDLVQSLSDNPEDPTPLIQFFGQLFTLLEQYQSGNPSTANNNVSNLQTTNNWAPNTWGA